MAIQKVQLTWDTRVNKWAMDSKTIKGVDLFSQNLAVISSSSFIGSVFIMMVGYERLILHMILIE